MIEIIELKLEITILKEKLKIADENYSILTELCAELEKKILEGV